MKKKEFEFLYDSSKIWFDSYNYHSGQKEGTYFLELRSDSDDFVVYDVFNDISYEIISYLSKGHVVLYGPDYRKTKHERRKRFGRGWEEAEYSTDCIASRLKQELMDSRWSDGFFADVDSFHEYKAFWSMTRVYSKYLYILQETLDFSLLQKTNTCREHPGEGDGIDIKIFPEATLTCLETAEKTVQF